MMSYPNRKNRVKIQHEKYLSETLEQNGDTEELLETKTDSKLIQEEACWTCQFCSKYRQGTFSEYVG